MAVLDRRTGREIPESGFGGGTLDFLYGNVLGRVLLKWVAAAPWFSRWQGKRRDRPASKDDILPFIEENHIDLTDEDRQLLENLCYGEFGTGGFIGAALIAQAVRDAMCFDGYSTVEDVIKYCRYDGSTTSGTSDECVQAVRYIFDDDGSAVQHRMLYMYNPYMVKSAFHESQNFILSYQGVRFFDRYGY